jgi:hypothetical protein
MVTRISYSLLFLLVLVPGVLLAKDKNKCVLPDYVLQAHTVRVLVLPDSSQQINRPMADSDAVAAVVRALAAWGRFTLVNGQESDLVIGIRAGRDKISPTIETDSTDSREDVQLGNSNVRIFGRQGHSPALADPTASPRTGPHVGKQVGRTYDTLEVFPGGVAYRSDSSPIWQYAAKDALKDPNVSAVEQFRKAIAHAEQSRSAKKP